MELLKAILSHPATAPHNLGFLVDVGQAVVGTLLIPFFVATSPGREMANETHALPQKDEQPIELVVENPQDPWNAQNSWNDQ